MADRGYRQRDPAFSDYERHKERSREDKRRRYTRTRSDRFTVKDFNYDKSTDSCRCPAVHLLYQYGKDININGFIGIRFRAGKRLCAPCPLRERCFTTPQSTETKQVTIIIGRIEQKKDTPIERMKWKFDTSYGRFVTRRELLSSSRCSAI